MQGSMETQIGEHHRLMWYWKACIVYNKDHVGRVEFTEPGQDGDAEGGRRAAALLMKEVKNRLII